MGRLGKAAFILSVSKELLDWAGMLYQRFKGDDRAALAYIRRVRHHGTRLDEAEAKFDEEIKEAAAKIEAEEQAKLDRVAATEPTGKAGEVGFFEPTQEPKKPVV